MLLWCLVICITVLITIYFKVKDPEPIYGIYKQPGKWYPLKYIIFLFIYYWRKFQCRYNPMSKTRKKPKEAGYGVKSHNTIEEMEVAQPLSRDHKAFDAVFFMASNAEGFYFVIGTERRLYNVVNGLCYLLIPGKGLLCSSKLPDTVLFEANRNEFGAEGISIKPIKAMQKWKITYNGNMWLQSDPSQVFNVNVDFEWCSTLPYFNYDTDLNPSTIARVIAIENWSRNYFNNLKRAHQTHYEQMGSIKGLLCVNGETYNIKMQSFRDHSYGNKRDWNLMHRYAFHMIFLEDGTMATVGVICQPCTCSMLECGYLYTPNGELCPLEWCTFKLDKHGENGRPPTDYGFQFKAGTTVYSVQVEVDHESVHYVGWNWEARMVERFVRYHVNGIPGHGISEFHYHSNKGRPSNVAANDPTWFQALKNK